MNDILCPSLIQRIYKAKTPPGRHKPIEGLEHLDKVIDIDQSPSGARRARTRRPTPAVRSHPQLFAKAAGGEGARLHAGALLVQRERRAVRGVPGRRHHQDRDALPPDVYVPCEVCKGARYNRETLEVTYRGKNIAEVSSSRARKRARCSPTARTERQLQTLSMSAWVICALVSPRPTVGRRGAARQARSRAREAGARATRSISSMSRPPACISRTCASCSTCCAPRRPGQHRPRHRAQPRRDQDGRLGHRPRPRGR